MSLGSDVQAKAHALARAHLSERSYAHCERVASTARWLAERHGVDPDEAEIAGMLHDYGRDESAEELLDGADAMTLAVLPLERENPYLLHARVAAARLRTALPDLPETVLDAVAAHTFGHVPMSDLDKVVYLADMIEPARTYAGVEDLRTSCTVDELAECFRAGYAQSVRRVREMGRALHPVSVEVARHIGLETERTVADPPVTA